MHVLLRNIGPKSLFCAVSLDRIAILLSTQECLLSRSSLNSISGLIKESTSLRHVIVPFFKLYCFTKLHHAIKKYKRGRRNFDVRYSKGYLALFRLLLVNKLLYVRIQYISVKMWLHIDVLAVCIRLTSVGLQPRGDAGRLSREYVLRIPSVS